MRRRISAAFLYLDASLMGTVLSRQFDVLNVILNITTDDHAFAEEFESIFGGRAPNGDSGLPRAVMDAELRTFDGQSSTLTVIGDEIADPAGFLLQFTSPTIPLRAAGDDGEWKGVAVGEETTPMFRFRENVCRIRRSGRWRRVVAHLLFLRMLALRKEAMFFHAASVGVSGNGILLIGPKGSGKSTLSLALASHGQEFLGDETAAYVPSRRTLLPFRRPVGIKPGPRASAVARSIDRVQPLEDEDGMLRVDAAALFPLSEPRPLPLSAVVFLHRFADEPALERIQPGRDELAQMQPIATTLTNAPASLRVFEMIRLLSSVPCYAMSLGVPDASAELLERHFSAHE